MPTTRVSAFRCGTTWPDWLDGVHPTVEDGKVNRKVCFSDNYSDCKAIKNISVINCDLTLSTNFLGHQIVLCVTVLEIECDANILRVIRRYINRSLYLCIRYLTYDVVKLGPFRISDKFYKCV